MKPLLLLLLASVAFGQRITVTYSHQPLEVFKAAFLSKLPNVALYEVLACNASDEGVKVSGGLFLQGAASRINIVNRGMVALTVARAREGSKKVRVARILKYLAMTGAILTAGDVVAVSNGIRVAFPSIVAASDQLQEEWKGEGVPATLFSEQYLAADREYVLAPRGCTSALFFGSFRRDFQPFTLQLP